MDSDFLNCQLQLYKLQMGKNLKYIMKSQTVFTLENVLLVEPEHPHSTTSGVPFTLYYSVFRVNGKLWGCIQRSGCD